MVGRGGAGSNTVNRMYGEEVGGVKLVAANTDMQYLVEVGVNTEILMDEQKTQNHGAGSFP